MVQDFKVRVRACVCVCEREWVLSWIKWMEREDFKKCWLACLLTAHDLLRRFQSSVCAKRHTVVHCTGRAGTVGFTVQVGKEGLEARQLWDPASWACSVVPRLLLPMQIYLSLISRFPTGRAHSKRAANWLCQIAAEEAGGKPFEHKLVAEVCLLPATMQVATTVYKNHVQNMRNICDVETG